LNEIWLKHTRTCSEGHLAFYHGRLYQPAIDPLLLTALSVAAANLNIKTICQSFCPGVSVTKATYLLDPRTIWPNFLHLQQWIFQTGHIDFPKRPCVVLDNYNIRDPGFC
jgi:hypothetical protein